MAPPVYAIEIFARRRLFPLIAVWKAVPVQPLYLSASEALPTATHTPGARLARLLGSSAKLGEVAESVRPLPKSSSWIPAWRPGCRLGLLCSWPARGCATACTPRWVGCSSLPGWLGSLSLLFGRRALPRFSALTASFSTGSVTLKKTFPALENSLPVLASHPLPSVLSVFHF